MPLLRTANACEGRAGLAGHGAAVGPLARDPRPLTRIVVGHQFRGVAPPLCRHPCGHPGRNWPLTRMNAGCVPDSLSAKQLGKTGLRGPFFFPAHPSAHPTKNAPDGVVSAGRGVRRAATLGQVRTPIRGWCTAFTPRPSTRATWRTRIKCCTGRRRWPSWTRATPASTSGPRLYRCTGAGRGQDPQRHREWNMAERRSKITKMVRGHAQEPHEGA